MLKIFLDDNSSFTDYSVECENFIRDDFSHTFISGEDYMYVGFHKPIERVYVEVSTSNTNSVTTTVEYYNGSSFTSVSNGVDLTNGLSRSGFIYWDRVQTDNAKTTVNSVEKYWYRISFSADTSAVTIDGVNILFSDDFDLLEVDAEVLNFKPSGDNSMVRFHQAARNEIVQRINNSGRLKLDENGYRSKLEAYDILDPTDLKEASKFLTLARIYEPISDEVDDKYNQKFKQYFQTYQDAFNLYMTSIDIDDDGVIDSGERNRVSYGRIVRV